VAEAPVKDIPPRLERLTGAEGPRLRAIRLRALGDAPDAFGSTLADAADLSAESWAKQVKDLPTFVAVSGGIDVGLVRCARDDRRVDTAWLISMWVAPDVRRMGVGAILVDAVMTWARSNGVSRLLLDVADGNAPAIALYVRKGFEPNGEVSTLPPPREHIREHQRELKL
jgi:GNAT superfamily N-acetyltransferase